MTLAAVGTLHYHHLTQQRPVWSIKARPHVMIQVKRILRRVEQDRTGAVFVSDTLDTARDIEWLHSRYPLEMSARTATVLAERVSRWTERQQVVDDILGGRPGAPLLGEPARKPRDYQLEFVTLARAVKRLILGDDAGLGKTLETLLLLDDPAALPALVVTLNGHLLWQWLGELDATWPGMLGHVLTQASPYDLRKARGNNGRTPDVLVMNYHKLAGWADVLAGQVRTVIFDECQELRTGMASAKGRAAAQIAEPAEYAIGASATPVYNWGSEAWEILDIIDPGGLGGWEEFKREWCNGEGERGKAIVTDPVAFGTHLRAQGKLLRRTRKDVKREMVEPVRIRHEIDADPAKIDELAGDALAMAQLVLDASADHQQRWNAAGQLDMQLRMATGVAKAPFVAEFVRMLLESEEKVLLYGWHRSVYSIWLDRLREFRPVLYTGSETPRQKSESVAAFLDGPARVMMMSLRAGAGIDGLQKASSVLVFGELDWSPGIHDQNIWRLDRDGQESLVTAYYLVSSEGSDPAVEDVLGLKRAQAEPMRNPDQPLVTPLSSSDPARMRKLAQSVLDRAAGKDTRTA